MKIENERLKQYIDRIERLEEEKAELAQDIKEVYAEAKATGFDAKIMRKVVQLRKRSTQELTEEQQLLKAYCDELGMQAVLL